MFKYYFISWLFFGFINNSTAQTSALEWYNEGVKLRNAKKYIAAADAFKKVVSLSPGYKAGWYELGWVCNERSQYDNAIDALKKLLLLDSLHQEGYFELGYAYKKKEQTDDAVKAFSKLLTLNKNNAAAWRNLGEVYRTKKEFTKSLECYNKNLQLMPNDYEALYQLGYTCNAADRYTEAIGWMTKALQVKKTAEVYNEIGFAYYKLKNNDEAIAAYKNALVAEPQNGVAYKGIGDVYRRNFSPPKIAEAVEAYKSDIALRPEKSAGSHFGIGWCFNEQAKYDEAIVYLKKAIVQDAYLSAAYTELVYALYKKNLLNEALSYYTKGVAADAKNVLVRYYAGLVKLAQKDKAGATIIYNDLKLLDAARADKLLAEINKL